MRPAKFYTVFENGEVIAICKGAAEARRLSPYRAYRAFPSRLEAEEFAMWWTYSNTRTSSPSMGRTAFPIHRRP